MDITNLTLQDFSDIELPQLSQDDLIGQGAVGKVYFIDRDKVVKVITPCDARKDTPLYRYCEDLLKIRDKIPSIPGGRGKKRYLLPNLLSEILVGKLVRNISFAKTLGSLIVDQDNIYILMQAYNPDSDQQIKDAKGFLLFLFQIVYGLYSSQQKYKFTHYDLHIENILWSYWDPELSGKDYISYPLPLFDSRILISEGDTPIYKISDFGLARMELQDVIIAPEVDDFPEKTYGEFSPSYDILCLLGSICISSKYRVLFSELFSRDPDLHKFVLMLLLWVLNDKEIKIGTDFSTVINQIGNKYYTVIAPNKFTFRPKKEASFLTYLSTKSMTSVVNFLSRILILKKYVKVSDERGSNIFRLPELTGETKYDKVVLWNPEIPLPETKLEKGQSISEFQQMSLDKYIQVRSYHVLTNSPPKTYNFTISDKQKASCPLQEHYMTAVFVNQLALQSYRFGFDCCKIDPVNYLLASNGPGFTINGGFFNIKDDFLPIGKYKDKHSDIDQYPVAANYLDVFGHVTLEANRLKIVRASDKLLNKRVDILTSGPMLIQKGKIVFDPNETRFDCTDEKTAGEHVLEVSEKDITIEGYDKYFSDGELCYKEFIPEVKTYPRCDKINPSELSHADNPNPRSAFCILQDGSYIFLTVEGRGNRGVGLDLYSLSQAILGSFPSVVSAINLDGGRSSNLAWRTNRDKTVYISNSDRNYVYPVGNMIYLLPK